MGECRSQVEAYQKRKAEEARRAEEAANQIIGSLNQQAAQANQFRDSQLQAADQARQRADEARDLARQYNEMRAQLPQNPAQMSPEQRTLLDRLQKKLAEKAVALGMGRPQGPGGTLPSQVDPSAISTLLREDATTYLKRGLEASGEDGEHLAEGWDKVEGLVDWVKFSGKAVRVAFGSATTDDRADVAGKIIEEYPKLLLPGPWGGHIGSMGETIYSGGRRFLESNSAFEIMDAYSEGRDISPAELENMNDGERWARAYFPRIARLNDALNAFGKKVETTYQRFNALFR